MAIVLFQYKPTTAADTLLRHHRIARSIVFPCQFAAVGMASSMAQIVIVGGDAVTIFLALLFTAISLTLIIPTICAIPWMSEIEKELLKRQCPIPRRHSSDHNAPRWALKMMFWFALAVALPVVCRAISTYFTM